MPFNKSEMSFYNTENNLDYLLSTFENAFFENKKCIEILKSNDVKMHSLFRVLYNKYDNPKVNTIRAPAKLDILD